MGFQQSVGSLRARLHLTNATPATLVGVVVAGALVVACAAFLIVQAVCSHELEVRRAQEVPESQERISQSAEDASAQEDVVEMIYVHVSGCVASPGLVCVEAGSRVAAAIEAAGGVTPEASVDAINLARVLVDGEQIAVPSIEEAASAGAQGTGAAVAGSASTPSAQAQAGRVNINTADAAALQTLSGIGESTAQKIIADRQANGPFQTIEDIKRVSGIGDKKFENIKDYICV